MPFTTWVTMNYRISLKETQICNHIKDTIKKTSNEVKPPRKERKNDSEEREKAKKKNTFTKCSKRPIKFRETETSP